MSRTPAWLVFAVGGAAALALANLYKLYRMVRLEEDLVDDAELLSLSCVHLHAEDRIDHEPMPATDAEISAMVKGGEV